MKKIILSFLLLLSVLGILLIPAFMMLHAHSMDNHHWSMESCIEHCLQSIDWFAQEFNIARVSQEIILIFQIFFVKIYTFALPLSLLYVYLFIPPPNNLRSIKNYNYSMLTGIVKLTT